MGLVEAIAHGGRLRALAHRTGQPRPLSHRGIKPTIYGCFFPDGKRVLYLGSKGNAPPRFWAQDVEGGEPRPVSPEGMRAGPAAISPDGKSFAAARSGSTIAVYPADGGEPRPLAGAEVEDVPVLWSADGRSLYVRRRTWRRPTSSGSISRPAGGRCGRRSRPPTVPGSSRSTTS